LAQFVEGGVRIFLEDLHGNDACFVAECPLDDIKSLGLLGGLAANEIGLYDMSGNVKEWCWDVWTDDGKISRRQRGGSWSFPESQCAFTNRGGSPYPQNRYDDIGFRLARKSGN
jgi:hypothetical protein